MIRTPDPALRRRMLYPTELPGQQKNYTIRNISEQGENMENLERTGYRFDGWFVDEARTKRINPGGKLPGSVTLYDKWIPITYSVTYDLGGGQNSEKNPQFITIESGLKKLYPSHKDGMVFAGWRWNGKLVEYLPEGIHEDIHLEAVYGKRPLISFETFEGARIADRQTNDAGKLDAFRPPMRLGYDFTGWYFDESLMHPVSENQIFKQDTVLYAGWKKSVYSITYNLNGGYFADHPIEEFCYDTPTCFLDKPVKPGFIFKGWKDRRGRILRSLMKGSMGERVLSAVWEKDNPEVHIMGETPQPLEPLIIEPQETQEEILSSSIETTEFNVQDLDPIKTEMNSLPAKPLQNPGIPKEANSSEQETKIDVSPANAPEQIQVQTGIEQKPVHEPKERVVLSRKARRMAAPDRFASKNS